ncbi:MAG: sugar ABC transporter permease [Actinomycetota bacterium]|nr:sugar ABC transporter permease [Actinomycetota bacterium]
MRTVSAVASEGPLRRPSRGRGRAQRLLAALPYIGPLLVAAIVVVLGPAMFGLSRSVFNWQPGSSSPFVGLANFRLLADSQTFRTILVNEGYFLLGLPVWTMLPLLIAVFLFARVRLSGLVRTLIFLPAVVSPALLGVMFTPILAPQGLVNTTLQRSGLGSLAHPWIDDPSLVKPSIIVLLAWANVGLGVAIFTAALTSIQPELLDAADVSGATSWQRIRYVILPGIRRTLILWTTFQALGVFLWLFGLIFALTAGGPGNSSTSIDYDVFTNTITNGLFGVGAAESVYLLVMVVLIVIIGWVLGRVWSHE